MFYIYDNGSQYDKKFTQAESTVSMVAKSVNSDV